MRIKRWYVDDLSDRAAQTANGSLRSRALLCRATTCLFPRGVAGVSPQKFSVAARWMRVQRFFARTDRTASNFHVFQQLHSPIDWPCPTSTRVPRQASGFQTNTRDTRAKVKYFEVNPFCRLRGPFAERSGADDTRHRTTALGGASEERCRKNGAVCGSSKIGNIKKNLRMYITFSDAGA